MVSVPLYLVSLNNLHLSCHASPWVQLHSTHQKHPIYRNTLVPNEVHDRVSCPKISSIKCQLHSTTEGVWKSVFSLHTPVVHVSTSSGRFNCVNDDAYTFDCFPHAILSDCHSTLPVHTSILLNETWFTWSDSNLRNCIGLSIRERCWWSGEVRELVNLFEIEATTHCAYINANSYIFIRWPPNQASIQCFTATLSVDVWLLKQLTASTKTGLLSDVSIAELHAVHYKH